MNHRRFVLLVFALLVSAHSLAAQEAPPPLPFRPGDRVVFLGDTFAEREAMFGYLETVLQTRLPHLKLTFRNLGYSADTPAVHLADIAKGDVEYNHGSNRPLNFGTMPKHLTDARADVIIMCFGMTDSFRGPAAVQAFAGELQELLNYHAKQKYNGQVPPRVILVGPIAHEKLGGDFPDPAEHNQSLQLYNEAIRAVAARNRLLFIDLFSGTMDLMRQAAPREPLTINGIHLTARGYWKVAELVDRQLFNQPRLPAANEPQGPAKPTQVERLRRLITARNQEFFHKWRAVNGEYIYGRRAKPFGVVNFPAEMAELDRICAELDAKIHAVNPGAVPLPPPDSRAAESANDQAAVADIKKTYRQDQGVIGGKEIPTAKDPAEALKHFKLPEGYQINLFASERDFPLHNPVAMAFDAKGRLWVTTMPSYPHALPGVPPDDKIVILEDTDGDGQADKHTVFADQLYLPTGIEFGNGGVFVGAQPNLLFLKDTDGDDKADLRETILHGFGSGDSHHAVHAFQWTPDGALLIHEGIFHRTNVETPWGPLRQRDAGIYRFQPRSHKLETFVSYHFANPWGHVFDKWGQNFIADASGGANYFGLPLTGRADFPRQHPPMKVFTSIVRPTCGCEIVASRHFPDEAQGNFLVPNNIGFQGIKQHKIIEEGSGFTSKEVEPLLFSTDKNFRPVALSFGPDGALYVVDWFNPLIGHMQHSLRDPGRDHYHGRIWRITAKDRPLLKPAKIAGEPTAALLQLLTKYEDRTRYRVRTELRDRPRDEVVAALDHWLEWMVDTDADHEHHLLEALWVYQGVGAVNEDLLVRLLRSKDHRARAAATRALRHWRDRFPIDKVYGWLTEQVEDAHPRVRLEAVVALSFFSEARAAEIALRAAKHPLDYYLDYGLKETLAALEPAWKAAFRDGKPFAADNPAGAAFVLSSLPTAELTQLPRSAAVYHALLAREHLPAAVRDEALHGLARLNKTDYLAELLAALERLDAADHGKTAAAPTVLHDLGHLLAGRPTSELAGARPRLAKLAASKQAMTRQVAYAALITADAGIERLWQEHAARPAVLLDVVESIPLVGAASLRTATYPKIKELLEAPAKTKADQQLRLAAINAAAAIPGHEAEIFATLARFVRDGVERDAAVAALRRLPKTKLPKEQLKPLAETILAHVGNLPAAQRSEAKVLDQLQLGSDLAALLGDDGKDLAAQFAKLGVQVVLIRTVPHNLAYDVAEFYVEAGKPVVIVLENPDVAPHNLVIAAPGSLTDVAQAAELLATNPNAFAMNFVPKRPDVLFATKLLQPRETDRLKIIAPSQPGKYVFVCTFPGHAAVMNGIMHVVPDLAAIPAADRVKMLEDKKWKVEELLADLERIDSGRSFARGKELFKLRTCSQCHKIAGEGGTLGPDLSELPKKLAGMQFTRTHLLTEILEPSKIIDKKYQVWRLILDDGRPIDGIILEESPKFIRLAKNAVEKPIVIAVDDIESKLPLQNSFMPEGLLNRLSREDILDLLAYLVAGGDPAHPSFRPR
ncbi:MAG: GDSL-type esterase/lipase family protein [Gemmataceae bacterium]|nr:GDSL-type esterase/lipase family protein [Gemmataceae bacterium]